MADGLWYRAGEALPTFTVPQSEGARALSVALDQIQPAQVMTPRTSGS